MTVFKRPSGKGLPLLAATVLLACVLLAPAARAQVGSDRYSSIVVDAASGSVLEAANPDAPRHPASLTKLMTLWMTFEALRDRRIARDQLVPVSAHAASMEPTKLGLEPGSRITVQQAILALVTKSANDAAAALGELLGGTEERFAQMMTLRAHALGMRHSVFTNASGLPDPDQWTSARDMAMLARNLLRTFPGEYQYFSVPSFMYGRRIIFNHDSMLRSYPGADGMKTGYTEASGHNLVTSAVRDNVRLVGVVLGAGSNGERDIHMTALLNQGFAEMDVAPETPRLRVARNRFGLISAAHAATVVTPRHAALVNTAVLHTGLTRAGAGAGSTHGGAVGAGPGWGVQVGAFASERAARDAAAAARRAADGGVTRVAAAHSHGRVMWRAQITGLTATEARGVCRTMAKHRQPCVPLRPEDRIVAAR